MQVDTMARFSPAGIDAIEADAWLDLFAAAPEHARREMGLASTRIGPAVALACRGMPITELNRSFGLADAGDGELAAITAWLDAHADPAYALQIASGPDAEALQRRAGDMGFSPSGNGWSKLVRHVDPPSLGPDRKGLPDGMEFVTDIEPAVYGDLVVSAFGFPRALADWFGALAGRPNWTTVVAMLDGRPAGSGAVFVKDEWAWLGVGATLPEARRRGVQGALIEARGEIARSKGAIHLTAETGRPEQAEMHHTSRDNLLRRGYVEAYHRLNLKRPS